MASAAQASKDASPAGKSKAEQVAMAAQAAADTARHEGLLPHQPLEPVKSVTLQVGDDVGLTSEEDGLSPAAAAAAAAGAAPLIQKGAVYDAVMHAVQKPTTTTEPTTTMSAAETKCC